MFKVLFLLQCAFVLGYRPRCDEKSVLHHIRIPTYDFAVRILDRVAQETDGHFIFSPISTWLQLLTLAEGAKGHTLNEILKVTKYYRMTCLRKSVKDIFNSLNEELRVTVQHKNIIVIDNLLNVKHSFIRSVEKLNDAKILLLNFRTIKESAAKVNEIIKVITHGKITETLESDDFIRSVLLMIDAACLKANWKYPFNPAYTESETFYSYEKIPTGKVNMMHQVGYFNTSHIPVIDAQALELPFNDRLTMILLLPNSGTAADLYWSMKKIRLTTILKLLKANGPKLVNVKIPRFKITTDIDNLPELLNDMGLQKIFFPRDADLGKISNYKVFVSMIINNADIEVTESGVSGNIGPEFLITAGDAINMFFNQPFAFIIVDKLTNVIIFAGIYSDPTVY